LKPRLISVLIIIGFLAACSHKNLDSNPETTQPLYAALTQAAATLRIAATTTEPTGKGTTSYQGGDRIEPENVSLLSPSMVVHHTNAYSIAFLPGGGEVVLLGTEGLATFDFHTGSKYGKVENLSLPMAINQPSLLNIARDRPIVAWVNNEKSVNIWNFTESEGARMLSDFDVSITGIALSPDGEGLAVSTYDDFLRVWESDFEGSPKEWSAPSWMINLSYSPDKKYIAGANPGSFKIYIFDTENGELQRTLEWFDTASPVLYGVYFSPDWKKIAWIARGSAQIMEFESGEYGPLLNHEDFISAVSWSPDGRLLATASAATVKGDFVPAVILWDVLSGVQLCTLSQSAPIVSLSFSPDGKILAVLDNTSELQTWSVNK
jgi:WD40 repeat protein